MNKKTLLFLFVILPFTILAQTEKKTATTKKKKKETIYFSWGYNTEWYTKSTVSVKQSALKDDYSLVNVTAHDHKGWDDGITNKALSIPQYNYRLGYFFNDKHDLGFEINFDHTKYLITEPQNIHVTGTLNGRHIDSTVNFQQANGFYYYLNNGANFLLFNITKRWHLYKSKNELFKVDALGKFGVGPLVPHVEDMFFGKANSPHFQVGGWNTGLEGCIKVVFSDWVFLEYSNKLDYARYSGLKVYSDGTAKQAFGTYEMILSLGITIPKTIK